MPPATAFFIACTALILTACSSVLPPIQSMSDARQAVKAARNAQVEDYLPATLAHIERRLQQAERELASGPHAYQFAHFNALVAKDESVHAIELVNQLRRAEEAMEKTATLGYLWSHTEALLQQAQDRARQGELDKAMRLAQKAEQQSLQAEQQAYLEQAKYWLQRASQHQDLTRQQQHALRNAQTAIQQGHGDTALEYLTSFIHVIP